MSIFPPNKVVAAVWQRATERRLLRRLVRRGSQSFSLAVMLCSGLTPEAVFAAKSSKNDKASQQKSCQVLTVSPAGKLIDRLPLQDHSKGDDLKDFEKAVESLVTAFRKGDSQALAAMFHPRLKMTAAVVANQLAELRARYVEPMDISPLKLLWLDTVDGDPAAIPCDFDAAVVNPLYGYKNQASILFQASGQLDIARIMIGLVPMPDRDNKGVGGWKIGYFYSQQWTHAGKDPLAWIQSARVALNQKHPYASWVQFDVAEKLLRSNGFASYAAHEAVIAERDSIMSVKDWLAETGKYSEGLRMEDAVSLLVPRGAGVLFKLRLVKELSTVEIQGHCKGIAKVLTQAKLSEGLSGIRCAYYRPGESLLKDSVTGGLFVPF